jgi:hypothetical protein
MVRIYTLVNGEQIIGEFVDSTAYIQSTIKDPYYIMEIQDEFGNNGMKLINVCTFSEEQCIVVNNKHIVFSTKANEPMTRYYKRIVVAHSHSGTSKMIEEAIQEMDDMENTMREVISKRLVGGSTIN